MFIERGKPEEIPKGAIRLTKDEVQEYMTDLIRKWPNTMELWALKHGNPILSSAVVLSSTVILNFYRKKLQLRNYGRFTLFLPIVLVPSIFNQIYQNTVTTKSIILQEDCPICINTQSMFIQVGTGIVYPLMSTIGGTYMFASKMSTFSLKSKGPDIVKEFALHVMKISRPLYNRLTAFVIGHVLLSYMISHYQMDNFEFLRNKMLQQQIEEIETLRLREKNQS
ncbi:uncharacterized protein LOC100160013 [Acyrthosiphon pisum]|uniref:ACYPI001347 protein n=1 Tax=Acyrthosiphon pisum TaxID=7029 RepID=C4WU84_ACYPI|nr:uncharacterized protein LOC100160013 [Acyrthosiphon pisum]BAH71454.1 ACYPI001347 [Acyrthosiphon pisum]|eukprot:NP_001155420.1 uncharacterized protein LOC100160013 [Acyrthosiphon pisum]